MRLKELKQRILTPIFYTYQLEKLFDEPKSQINTQLARMVKRGDLVRLKRGVFIFSGMQADEFAVADCLFQPSYISLESALNSLGVMPDVFGQVTSITTITSRVFTNNWGTFSYSKIDKRLYFGFERIEDGDSQGYYNMALPEKALLDYLYIRRVSNLENQRIDFGPIEKKRLSKFAEPYPGWVRKAVL